AGRHEDAAASYHEGRELFLRFSAKLDALSELNMKGSVKAAQDGEAAYEMMRSMVIAVSLAIIAIGGLVAWRTGAAIAHPLQASARLINEMAQGNDLTRRIDYQSTNEIGIISTSFDNLVTTLRDALGRIATNTRQVAGAAGQASSAIGQISDGAQHQFTAFQQIAEAMRQTANAVGEVARVSAQASGAARTAAGQADDGQAKMGDVVSVVRTIADSSKKISQIAEIIARIAAQTNMLSLNAAIEAARAGEHGKGFAVVAEEVRKLADSTSGSAGEIAALVAEANREAERAVHLVDGVNGAISGVAGSIRDADSLMQQIASAITQQSASVEEINANLAGLGKIGQTNAAAAEEITATMCELARLADETRTAVEMFRV
ncbi:MAG: methyl-accepting chemotaxis protein, partial [Rhodospirillales bacterium]|nr:methyl-accepting chemotaxis protein [Rhodospirillales bacterium]